MYKDFFKRFIDVFCSAIILLFLWPVFLIIAIAIKLDSEGPVIFKQTRLGLDGKEFSIYKFRTMVVDAEKGGVYSDDNDPRITRVGNILRKTSLDELSQIINILEGDMSFVGPRPPLTYHPWPIDEYTPEQLRMFEVRPGITGWAQINGRKAVEWNHRIELNVWYVDNVSFLTDIKILFTTVLKVIKNEDNENVGATVQTEAQEESTPESVDVTE
jgi:sugar transferase EpsL